MPIESLANAFHLLGSVKHNLTVWGRVRVAYPQKTRNKPAERRALDARFPAARPPFKRDLYCAGENREKRAASRVSLSQSRVCHPRPQTGP